MFIRHNLHSLCSVASFRSFQSLPTASPPSDALLPSDALRRYAAPLHRAAPLRRSHPSQQSTSPLCRPIRCAGPKNPFLDEVALDWETRKVLKEAAKTRKVSAPDALAVLSRIKKATVDTSTFFETIGGTKSPEKTATSQ